MASELGDGRIEVTLDEYRIVYKDVSAAQRRLMLSPDAALVAATSTYGLGYCQVSIKKRDGLPSGLVLLVNARRRLLTERRARGERS